MKKTSARVKCWPLLAALALLAGCVTDPTEVYRESREKTEETRERIEAADAASERGLVRNHQGPYLDRRPITRPADHAYLDEMVSLRVEDLPLDLTMERAIAQLSRAIAVSYEALSEDEREEALQKERRCEADARSAAKSAEDAARASRECKNNQLNPRTRLVTLRVDGRFEELLNAAAASTGLGYELGQHGALRWTPTITRTYSLWRVPGNRTFSMSSGNVSSSALSGGGGSGGVNAGPQSSDSVSLSSSGNFWTELRTTLNSIMNDEDDELSISQSLGTVTASGLAPNVREVGRHIQKLNEELARQILLEVQVLEISTRDESNAGVDWAAFRESLAAADPALTEVGGANLLATSSAQGTQLPQFAFLARRAGTTAAFVVRALREQGVVSVQTSPRVVTLNGEMARILLLEDRSIIAETETTITDGVTSTELQTGTLSTGFSLSILPRIVRDDILLQASVSISSLLGITPVNASGVTIQLPEVQRNVFFQSALLQSQQSLLIGGIRRQRSERSGAHLPGVKALGRQGGQVAESETVLLITPTLVAGGNPRQ